MRFVLFGAAAFLCSASLTPQALALSPCPLSDFMIVFTAEEAQLDAGDLATVEAAVNRARQCDIGLIELIVDGDIAANGSLSQRRAAAVREALVSHGLNAALMQTRNRSSERLGVQVSPSPAAVTAVFFFK